MNYTYTADGKISAVTDSTRTTTFTYDLMDGLTRVDYPDGNYMACIYDNACRLTKVTTHFGSTSYEYDANKNRIFVHFSESQCAYLLCQRAFGNIISADK